MLMIGGYATTVQQVGRALKRYASNYVCSDRYIDVTRIGPLMMISFVTTGQHVDSARLRLGYFLLGPAYRGVEHAC
jgi:hypothetical protein